MLVTIHETETEPPSSTNGSGSAVTIMFQVTQIVRFLLERGLRFRNLGFCGHDLMQTATFNAPGPVPSR